MSIDELNALPPGTWIHPNHADAVDDLRARLWRATGDPTGWGHVRRRAEMSDAAQTAALVFRVEVDDVQPSDQPVPPAHEDLVEIARDVDAGAYDDAPVLGAAARLLGAPAERARAALLRHYVVVHVHNDPRRLGGIGSPVDGAARALSGIADCAARARAAHGWLIENGALDVRALALLENSYYLLPIGVAGVLRALIGCCGATCQLYERTADVLTPETCACEMAVPALYAACNAALRAGP